MLITIAFNAGVGLGAGSGFYMPGGIAAGTYRNYIHFDPRLYVDNFTDLRLVRYNAGRANREVEEIPGVTRNLDHNVLMELVRVTVNPSNNLTDYGTVPGQTNGGLMAATGFNATTPDDRACWRTAWQVRRGLRKRWDWGSAPRLGRDPVSGWRELFVNRYDLEYATSLGRVFSFTMDLATSPEDVPA